MKLTKRLVECISGGVRTEIKGVGYLFTKGDLSLITCYNTSARLYSFNNTEISVDIRPYDVGALPLMIGSRGEKLTSIKQQIDAREIRAIEVSTQPNFCSLKSTTYKHTVKNGDTEIKKKVAMSHLSQWAYSDVLSSMQKLAFILISGEPTCDLAEGHKLFSKTSATWNLRRIEEMEEHQNRLKQREEYKIAKQQEDKVEVIRQQWKQLGQSRVKLFSRNSMNEMLAIDREYQYCYDDLMDQKYILRDKGKKYSKNMRVCMNNNNANSWKCRDSKGSSKRDVIKHAKVRSMESVIRDVKRVRKQSRNWKCAPAGTQSMMYYPL